MDQNNFRNRQNYGYEEDIQDSRRMVNDDYDEEQRRIRRQKKIERMRREKQRYMRRMRMIKIGIPAVLVLVLLLFGVNKVLTIQREKEERNNSWQPSESKDLIKIQEENERMLAEDAQMPDSLAESEDGSELTNADGQENTSDESVDGQSSELTPITTSPGSYHATEADTLTPIDGEVVSTAAVVIDRNTEEIIAQRDAKARISPASMTKILTVLVAAEHVTNLDDKFTITREITDFGYLNDCSSAGFAEDEEVTVRDLLYGTILPSGADAAVGLATYVAGSQEAFVDLMNEKLKELGLSETTHFTNCVGIYNDDHYSTAYDMAMIIEAAVDNPICREVMSAHTYKTSITEQHPEGIIISNWFLRRIEDKETGGEVLCAKTGYVVQSGNCAASYSENDKGQKIVCVTAGSTSSWRCIYDHVAIYSQFMK